MRVCEEVGSVGCVRREEIALIYLLSHAGEQQPIHSLQSGDGSLLLLVVQTLGEKEGEGGRERRRERGRRRRRSW